MSVSWDDLTPYCKIDFLDWIWVKFRKKAANWNQGIEPKTKTRISRRDTERSKRILRISRRGSQLMTDELLGSVISLVDYCLKDRLSAPAIVDPNRLEPLFCWKQFIYLYLFIFRKELWKSKPLHRRAILHKCYFDVLNKGFQWQSKRPIHTSQNLLLEDLVGFVHRSSSKEYYFLARISSQNSI